MALRATKFDEDASGRPSEINNLGSVFNGVNMALRATEFDESQVTAAIACTEASSRRGRNRSGLVEAVKEYEPGARERTR
jgi:hypothetical protein